MSDTQIVLNPGAGGDKVDADDLGGIGTKRQRSQIGGGALSEIARVANAAPSGADYGLVVRQVPAPENRSQVAGAGAAELARVANVAPTTSDYGLVVRQVPDPGNRTQVAGAGAAELARVANVAAATTDYGLVVRPVADPGNRTQIGGPTAVALATVGNAAPTTTDYGLTVRVVPAPENRSQVAGSAAAELARVMNTVPVGTEYGLVARVIARQASTCAQTNVAASVSSVNLLSANANRKRVTICNDPVATSGSRLYICAGAGPATSSNFVEYLDPGETFYDSEYTGQLTGIWVAANGVARVGEWT
ncbi:MAG TPA: hypothetical protein VFA62_05385 [Acidimicrobiia bacterium]|nr:hypothetical protein [Acidimicrobiia bacterium]